MNTLDAAPVGQRLPGCLCVFKNTPVFTIIFVTLFSMTGAPSSSNNIIYKEGAVLRPLIQSLNQDSLLAVADGPSGKPAPPLSLASFSLDLFPTYARIRALPPVAGKYHLNGLSPRLFRYTRPGERKTDGVNATLTHFSVSSSHGEHVDGMQRSSGVPEHTDKKLNEPLPNWHLRNRRLASSDASRTTAESGTIGSRAEKWQNRLPPSYQLKQMQTVLKQMQVLETDPKKVAPPSLRMEPSRGSHEGATAQFDANKYLFRPDETVHTNVATEDTRFQTTVLPKTRNTLDTPEEDEYLGSLPFVLPLYSSNFAAETPYMNTSQLLLTEEPPLPALTRYYTQLGNITTLYPLIHNVTPPINETIGIDTVTTFLQSVLDEDMRNRIVAATPPRVFGRVEELFWGTAVRFWRAWVDSWRDLKENPPHGWGWKREEAEGYRNIYNEFASWAYDAPFSLYDMLFNATILYSFPILQTRGDAIARRDEVLARDMEKQAIFYAPIFYSSMSIMQHIEYFKKLLFNRIDAAIQPVTTTAQTGRQFVSTLPNAGNIVYGLLQVCALYPECCQSPSRCYPTTQENRFKNINLKTGVSGL